MTGLSNELLIASVLSSCTIGIATSALYYFLYFTVLIISFHHDKSSTKLTDTHESISSLVGKLLHEKHEWHDRINVLDVIFIIIFGLCYSTFTYVYLDGIIRLYPLLISALFFIIFSWIFKRPSAYLCVLFFKSICILLDCVSNVIRFISLPVVLFKQKKH